MKNTKAAPEYYLVALKEGEIKLEAVLKNPTSKEGTSTMKVVLEKNHRGQWEARAYSLSDGPSLPIALKSGPRKGRVLSQIRQWLRLRMFPEQPTKILSAQSGFVR